MLHAYLLLRFFVRFLESYRAPLTIGARGVEVRLTGEIVGNVPIGGFCLFCTLRDGNSFIDAPNPNSFNDPPNVFTHPPQPQYESYPCELCGNDAHYGYDCPPWVSLIEDYRNKRIDIHYRSECEIKIDEHKDNFNKMSIEIKKKEKELRQQEQAANNKFIKSSVEDLVPIPSESKDTLNSDSECDLPFCDNPMTFSNPLFDTNNDFTSSDDESLPEEDVPKENFKIYSNPLFEFDDEYISSDVNPLFNEMLEDIKSEDSYVSKLDEPDLLVTHLSKLNEDECFDPGGDFILEEIEACPTSDLIPPRIDDADFDPEGDILLLENLLNDDPSSPLPQKNLILRNLNFLIKDTILNLPPEVFLDRDPRSLEDESDKDDLKNIVKVFDPRIQERIISPTYVRLSFEDHKYLSLTYVIRIFLSYLTYSMDSSFLLSSGSEDTIFDPDISIFSFYSLEPTVSHWSGTFMRFNVYLNILNGSSMEICSSTCFVPNITMIWGESS
ncbi:hypothetical protein Tco_0878477 [Tanacetum coccineum]|uniref:Uncharacterized protein n=1 Tax=Tanacetum coccineum TaxID=301880 RepID=A0ABQ5C1G5_9ASTR